MFNIVIKNGKGETLDTIECPVDVCAIGKARSNLVQLRGWRVAPQHAEIHRTSEGLFLERVSQKASVEVNGNSVDHYGPLRTADQIYIAGYYLQVGELAKRASSDDSKAALTRAGSGASHRDDDDEDDNHLKTVIGVPRHAVLEDSEELSKTLLDLRHKDKFKWRNRVHEELLAAMDLRRTDISSMSEADLRKHVKGLIKEIIVGLGAKLPADVDHSKLAKEVLDEAVGLGPLEDLLADETVSEIMVNKYDDIYIERGGRLTKSEVTFSSDDAVMSAIERIVTIEDAAELQLHQPHVVSLETKHANMEGRGAFTIRDLVRNSLRMRPDRIVVGECRGGEALDMLQAMNTGHDGSLTTIHANSPVEALSRLETLVLMAGVELPSLAIREQIARSIHVIVQQTRLTDGSRKITHVSEIDELDPSGRFEVRDIFEFEQTGVEPDGKVIGDFEATGYLPSFLDEILARGLVKPGEPFL